MTRFAGKVAVVTGAASGFGAAISRRLAAEEASVVLADLDPAAADVVAKEIGDNAIAVEVDVRSADSVRAMIEVAQSHFGGLDILVNNAGIVRPARPIEETPEDEYDIVMDVNVRGVFNGVKFGVPALRARGGVIINTCSSAVQPVSPLSSVYTASKGAVYSLTRELALELAPTIRVNCVVPSLADTNLPVASYGARLNEDAKRTASARIPLGRLCEPADVAASVAFLASDEAAYLTGVCLPVDGGKAV